MEMKLGMEPLAQIAAEFKRSGKRGAELRWAKTADQREQRNATWCAEAERIRQAHPKWSIRSIAASGHRKCEATETTRTVIKVITPHLKKM